MLPNARLLKPLILSCLLLPLLMPGCANVQQIPIAAPVVNNSGCRTFKPIRWVPADTPPTIDAVRQHNAKHASICGAKK